MTATNPIRTPASITIADRAGKSFPLHAHTEGYARWKSGSVAIEHESPRAIQAKVRGDQTRDVRLQEQDGRLLVQCTCPARTYETPGCKHVWATLLEVDRRGALGGLRAARTPLAVAFLEPKPANEPPKETAKETPKETAKPPKKESKEKKEKRKAPKVAKVSPPAEAAADPASPRSPRATAARPEGRGTRRRSPLQSSTRRR